MKTGRTLTELAQELDRQARTRRDYVAPTTKLRAVLEYPTPERAQVMLAGFPDDEPLAIGDLAHQQIAQDLAIPKPYYDRMRAEAPQLLAQNVNHWLQAQPAEKLVRTIDGRVRAFLSSKYRPLDNLELLAAVLPAFRDLGGISVESAEVTETHLYLKAVMPSLQWDMAMVHREAMRQAGRELHAERPGEDVVQAAVMIGNSEVGHGALFVEEAIYRLTCYNLATVQKTIRKYHVGRRHGKGNGNGDHADDEVWQLLTDEAQQADDRAFWLRVRDVVRAVFTRERFEANARRLAETAGDPIEGKVEKTVEVVAVRFGLADDTREGILRHLIEGADLSRFGLINAVTRASQDEADYDAATDLERLGGKILELPRGEWAQLAQAA